MVVLVLMINCHVSLKSKNGPEMSQARIIKMANPKVKGFPEKFAAAFENLVKSVFFSTAQKYLSKKKLSK